MHPLPWLTPDSMAFPSPATALTEPDGLLAVGGDLSCQRLLTGYSQGIFPWYGEADPILWWSPSIRMVIFPERLKVSRSLKKSIRNRQYCLSINSAFRQVIEACAAPRGEQEGTWIIPDMVEAYCALHQAGYAHSFEMWEEGELVGGLYGVSLGAMFWGESMFCRRRDASKITFAYMVDYLAEAGMTMMDCQFYTAHLASLGACEISREAFLKRIAHQIKQPVPVGLWAEKILQNADALLERIQGRGEHAATSVIAIS